MTPTTSEPNPSLGPRRARSDQDEDAAPSREAASRAVTGGRKMHAMVAALVAAGVGVIVIALVLLTASPSADDPSVGVGASSTAADVPVSCSSVQPEPKVVFLDPGHGADLAATRATSGGSQGIYSGENSSGGNEPADVFAVALAAKGQLETDGYTVVLSRTADPDPAQLTLWEKGLLAQTADGGQAADIGVSIHTDLAGTIGAGQIYYDSVGAYRTNTSDGFTAEFTNSDTAALSHDYALNFQKTRAEFQGEPPTVSPGHEFPAGRGLGSSGNIPIIMLTAQDVPWVYNEMARTTAAGLSEADLALYAEAIVKGVESSLGPVSQPSPSCS